LVAAESVEQQLQIPSDLPVLPLRDIVIYPFMIVPLFVSREKSIRAVDEALGENRMILLASQRDLDKEEPGGDDLYSIGTVAVIMRMLKLPDGIDDKTAAAMMLKGLTTQYLIRQTYRVKAGDTILLHAAAGGVGLILGQWAKHLGATVIGTVSSDEKAKLAQAHGCAHTIIYTREDFVKRVDEITGGKKVPVVYDSVGKDTFLKSLDCLAPLGVAALFGASSGNVDPLNLGLLAQKGSLYVTRPSLNTYAAKRENLVAMANELFDVVKSGAVKIEVNQTYPLKDAAKAHADLAARKTTGSTVLLV